MLSSRKLIRLYQHLQNSLEAGLTLSAAWDCGPPGSSRATEPARRALDAGFPVGEALDAAHAAIPVFDRQMLRSASATARLPDTLGRLTLMHERKMQVRSSLILAVAYPLLLAHLGALLFPILNAVDLQGEGLHWSTGAYLVSAGGTLLVLWSLVGLCWVLLAHPLPALQGIRRWIPVAGKYQRHRALADFSFGLGILLDAGVPVPEAWRRAARLSGSNRLLQAAEQVARSADHGQPPGAALEATSEFPGFFSSAYRTGETTGSLLETLEKQAVVIGRMAEQSLKMLWVVLPLAAILVVAGMIAFKVLSFFGDYLELLESF